MCEVKAAELPEGSVVASRERVFIRTDSARSPWTSTDRDCYPDRYVDEWLQDGSAVVLRHGYGSEGKI